MCCFPKRIRMTAITTAAGATTITLPASPEINAGDVVDICLYTAIPSGTDGTTVSITNGTVTGYLMACNGNYFRPLPLRSRTILRAQFLNDPAHFQLLGVKR